MRNLIVSSLIIMALFTINAGAAPFPGTWKYAGVMPHTNAFVQDLVLECESNHCFAKSPTSLNGREIIYCGSGSRGRQRYPAFYRHYNSNGKLLVENAGIMIQDYQTYWILTIKDDSSGTFYYVKFIRN